MARKVVSLELTLEHYKDYVDKFKDSKERCLLKYTLVLWFLRQ